MRQFKYTEYVIITLIFTLLLCHVLGYDSLLDYLLIIITGTYLGIDMHLKRQLRKSVKFILSHTSHGNLGR